MKQIEIPFENKSFHFSKNDFALAEQKEINKFYVITSLYYIEN
jgi:hypothetical protein